MNRNGFEKLDLSFLPEKLAQKTESRLEKVLTGLSKIKWPIKAVVLGGGYKRKELTYNDWNIGSDIDLFIFSNFIPFFWRKLIKIQNEINQNEFFFHYRGVIPWYLSKSRTFWAYKLKNEGIVLNGDESVLEKIQAQESNIPKIEAIRILFQTLVVWLMLSEIENRNSDKKVNPFTILRSYLNIGESYLTFFGYLKPSYRERMEEFERRIGEFRIERELAQKIILGYLTKVNPKQARIESQNYQLSLSQAKRDCLRAIDHLLSLHLKIETTLTGKLDILAEEIKPKWLFNFIFFSFSRNIKGIQPKVFPIILRFKITDLWKIAFYNETGQWEKRDSLLNKYFLVKNFSDEALIKIYESHPSYTLIEID